MTTKAILLETANFIEKRGWAQRSFETSDGRVCILEALTRVCRRRCEDTPMALSQAVVRLRETAGLPRSSLPLVILQKGLITWNDEPGRTKEEVIETLRKAALG